MSKYSGILLAVDLDDTLLSTDKSICRENIEAINEFKAGGGMFAFATGRVSAAVKPFAEAAPPNVPIVCCNGVQIYDLEKERVLWTAELEADAADAVRYIYDNIPYTGIEVIGAEHVFVCRGNDITEHHIRSEQLKSKHCTIEEIDEPMRKVMLMQSEELVPSVRAAVKASPYADKYEFMQSSPQYYEMLPRGITKGGTVKRLAALMGAEHIITAGDSENDVSLMSAGFGAAAANAVQAVKDAAVYVTKADNNHGAVAEIIYNIDNILR